MDANIEIKHGDLYPDDDLHQSRIDTFVYKLNRDIVSLLNLKKHHSCWFAYDTGTLKFRFLRSDSPLLSERLTWLIQQDHIFYNDFINTDIPYRNNYFSF
ncbi:hypothetical protein [Abyssalbus ytuae]|uniref:Uncharacterized protein n=1 Tax=Abyssalbus ytuae TaxID=2926907 RepID=A0A9E6ZPM0_9FLAO|nr:hypothetical protein [Abyssalbus ytuae]UOB18574.1 hypothetical protein MQE35_04620 [Abyssalbus ytuae]